MNSKQTQKHQLGILRDSFKKQMDEKDRKLEDLELLLAEATGGVRFLSPSQTSLPFFLLFSFFKFFIFYYY